jgi:hypothetical protein
MEVFVTNGLDLPSKKSLMPSRDLKIYEGLSSDSLQATTFTVVGSGPGSAKNKKRPPGF